MKACRECGLKLHAFVILNVDGGKLSTSPSNRGKRPGYALDSRPGEPHSQSATAVAKLWNRDPILQPVFNHITRRAVWFLLI
jgi:hypothetical protein